MRKPPRIPSRQSSRKPRSSRRESLIRLTIQETRKAPNGPTARCARRRALPRPTAVLRGRLERAAVRNRMGRAEPAAPGFHTGPGDVEKLEHEFFLVPAPDPRG